jgi:hypothetical protein
MFSSEFDPSAGKPVNLGVFSACLQNKWLAQWKKMAIAMAILREGS